LLNDAIGVMLFLLHRRRPKGGLSILCYHRMARGLPRESPFNAYNVEPEVFAHQLAELKQFSDVTVISASELARWIESTPPTEGAYLMLTFDDVWRHSLDAARQMATDRVPGSFYVPTGHIGSRFFAFSAFDTWCSRQPNVDSKLFTPVAFEDCRELRRLGMEIQPHGHSHRSLGNIPRSEMEADIRSSVEVIQGELKTDVFGFCYPFGSSYLGDFDTSVIEVLRRSGVRFALSTDAGCNSLSEIKARSHRLKRIPVNDYDRGLFFRAKVAGYCGVLPAVKAVVHTVRRTLGKSVARLRPARALDRDRLRS
jgi:peptidoglycan/xylan/chitin deacetylase (PgdA/CDA1 family)